MVYLVGAGPGDPGLITVKGLELLRRADVVVYDQLASPALLKEAQAAAELFYVGKKAGAHAVPQGGINELLVQKAKAGLTVVRLKGGDPFVFGRGGEEAEELAAAGVPFEIVPGVTSAVAVPAYAGIPVTHRRYTTLVTFITGHEDPTKDASTIPWAALGQNPGTLVFLMGVKNLAENCRQLVQAGRAPETPAAVIEKGTTLAQRTVVGTLADIAGARERSRDQAAGGAGGGRRGGPGRNPEVVGKPPLVGQNRGSDPVPGPGVAPHRTAEQRGGPVPGSAHHRDQAPG